VIQVGNRNDVAKRAGVSGATVSRVFNNPGSVSPETREKVMKACEELNYHPNVIASNFVRGISGNIGVIIPYIPNVHIFSVYYFSELLSGIGEALQQNGYDLLLFFHKTGADTENEYAQYFNGGKVDGCILLGTHRNDFGLIKLRESGCKFCMVNNYIENSGISFIDVDNTKGSRDAVEYLIRLGHREIAFLNGPAHFSNSVDRMKGYTDALGKYDIPLKSEYLLEGNYGKKSGYTAAKKILSLDRRPTAVFAGNDRMAAGLVYGLKEQGVRTPEDIAVIGYDDSDTATLVDPNLTTVHIPFFEIGKRCVEEFIRLIQEPTEASFEIFVEPELVVRKSSGEALQPESINTFSINHKK
jgi:LacI family transcriptional regulator